MMKSFMNLLVKLYSDENLSKLSSVIQKSSIVLTKFAKFTNITSMMWSPSVRFRYWSNYQIFFATFSHSGIDKLASAAELLKPFVFFIISLLILNFLFLLLYFTLEISCSKSLKIIKHLLKLFLFVSAELLFIPCNYTLAMILKYSLEPYNNLEEYEETYSSSTLDFGTLGIAGSLILTLIHLITSISHIGFNFQMIHSSSERSLKSKSSINQELFIHLGFFMFSFCYPFFLHNYYIFYQIFLACFLIYCIYHHSFQLPYASYFTNYLNVLKYSECFCLTIFFICGYFFNNAVIILVLSAIMQPVILISVDYLIKWRIEYLKQSNSITTYSSFEFSNRESFLGRVKNENLMRESNLVYHSTKNRLIRVLQAYYCLDILSNAQLASIKISLNTLKFSNIFANFQIFKCAEKIKNSELSDSLTAKVLKFMNDHRYVLDKEKKYCLTFLELIEKFHEVSISHKILESLTGKTRKIIKNLAEKYKELIASYPDSNIILKSYGSFLVDLVGDTNLGQMYLSRTVGSEFSYIGKSKKVDMLSDESVCFLVISASSKNPGKILNANQSFCNFIEIEFNDLKSLNIKDIIPDHKDFDTKKFINEFTEKSDSHIVFPDEIFFLKDKNGFLKECLANTQCIGHELKNKFVSVIQPRQNIGRLSALVYLDGIIFAHSEGFPQVFGLSCFHVEKMNIIEFVGDVNLFSLHLGKPLFIRNKIKGVLLSFKLIVYKKVQFCLLTCYTNSNDIDKIESGGVKKRGKSVKRRDQSNKRPNDCTKNGSRFEIDSKIIKNIEDPKGLLKNKEKDGNVFSNSTRNKYEFSHEYKMICSTLNLFRFIKISIFLLVSPN